MDSLKSFLFTAEGIWGGKGERSSRGPEGEVERAGNGGEAEGEGGEEKPGIDACHGVFPRLPVMGAYSTLALVV